MAISSGTLTTIINVAIKILEFFSHFLSKKKEEENKTEYTQDTQSNKDTKSKINDFINDRIIKKKD